MQNSLPDCAESAPCVHDKKCGTARTVPVARQNEKNRAARRRTQRRRPKGYGVVPAIRAASAQRRHWEKPGRQVV